jgi:putative ABC transport system ATP-binding protein/lipoprotein-releasing system ATP-binding protein
VIAVEGLEFRYRSGVEELFGGLDHEFPAGSLSVVTGASGRGKSTLLYLLGLLLTPTAGVVRVADTDTGRLSDRQRSQLRARHIGFVFQDAALDASRSVLDNVVEGAMYAGIARTEAETEARALLERTGVTLREGHKPGEVSGGQAQRVGLCRALIKSPTVILADEPTGNLDASSADVVLGGLKASARSGVTVVIASHDPRIVETADHVLPL